MDPPTAVGDLFRAARAIWARALEIDRVSKLLGSHGHKLHHAAQEVVSRIGAVTTALPLREEFAKLLRELAADNGFNPFRLPSREEFAVESQPAGLDALESRLAGLERLNDMADVYHSYVTAIGGSFFSVPRETEAAAAVAILGEIGQAILATRNALSEAREAADIAERTAARNRAQASARAAEEARAEAQRARQRAADADAAAQAAEMASMGGAR